MKCNLKWLKICAKFLMKCYKPQIQLEAGTTEKLAARKNIST